MRNSDYTKCDLRDFHSQKPLSYPSGYVCLIRDVAFNRYLLLRINDPRQLDKRLRQCGDFDTELARAWRARDAEAAERKLRAEYSRGAASGEWFDMDAENAPRAERSAPRRRSPRQNRRRVPQAPAYPDEQPSRSLRTFATVVIALLLVVAIAAPRFGGLPYIQNGRVILRQTNTHSANAVRPDSPEVVKVNLTDTHMKFNWTRVDEIDGYEFSYRINDERSMGPYRTRSLRTSAKLPASGAEVEFEVAAYRGVYRSKPVRLTVIVPGEEEPEAQPVEKSRSYNRGGQRMFVTAREHYTIHVRQCASTSCAVIGRLQNGQWITALEVVDGDPVGNSDQWARFDYNGRDGYAHLPLLSPSD